MTGFIENAKGVVSITRDGLITLVLILLLLVPASVNQRLISAGFVKGSIAGFEWQSAVKTNNEELSKAAATIDTLQKQLSKTEAALKTVEESRQSLAEQVTATIPDSPVAETAAAAPPATTKILQQNDQLVKSSQAREMILRQQIRVNDNLLARVARPAGQ